MGVEAVEEEEEGQKRRGRVGGLGVLVGGVRGVWGRRLRWVWRCSVVFVVAGIWGKVYGRDGLRKGIWRFGRRESLFGAEVMTLTGLWIHHGSCELGGGDAESGIGELGEGGWCSSQVAEEEDFEE